jgi:hypothetical protein
MTAISPYLFDPVSGSRTRLAPVDPWPMTDVLPVGYRATVTDPIEQTNRVCEVWSLPITVVSSGVIPMRHTQRNDGYGIDERHGRLRGMKAESASSTEATGRIFGSGSNTYR